MSTKAIAKQVFILYPIELEDQSPYFLKLHKFLQKIGKAPKGDLDEYVMPFSYEEPNYNFCIILDNGHFSAYSNEFTDLHIGNSYYIARTDTPIEKVVDSLKSANFFANEKVEQDNSFKEVLLLLKKEVEQKDLLSFLKKEYEWETQGRKSVYHFA